MRGAAIIAAYAAIAAAQSLDVDAIAAAEPVPTPEIPVVYSYSANYAVPSATITANVVSYNPSAAVASVSADVAASAIADNSDATTSSSDDTTASTTATATASDTQTTGVVSKRSTAGSCSALAALGSTYTSTAGNSYTVQCGTDYGGYDLASASSSTFAGCYALCDAYKGCVSFAYVPGTCYLKRAGGVATSNSGVNAGALVNMPTTNPTLCVAQPTGISHTSSPDTDSGFLADSYYSSAASQASTPSGYDNVFTNLQASNNALGYLGYSLLNTYDTLTCSQRCDAVTGCQAFNIYFERDPSVDPNDSSCSNPSSYTQIKCVYWGGPVTAANALNVGQYRNQFHVVMAGSNGYVNQSIDTPTGYTAPAYLGSSVIVSPTVDCAGNSPAIDSYVWTTGPFNADLCAAACSAYNTAGPTQTCQFFNTYVVYANGKSAGQYCQLYSQSYGSSYATSTGSTINGVKYTYGYSFTSSNATQSAQNSDYCQVASASSAIASASLQPYCSSLLGYFPSTATVTATLTTTAVSTETDTITATSVTTITSRTYAKRALATPSALTAYAASIISSACSLEVSPVTTTATVTGSTAVFTAATSVATSFTTVTTASTAVAAPTGMVILSAIYASTDVTNYAQAAFPNGNTLVINCANLPSALGDPWSGTKKSFDMLYSFNGDTRVFSCYDGQGSYTLTASSTPNGAVLTPTTAPSGSLINLVAAMWSWEQIGSSSVISALYSAANSGSSVAFSNGFFGFDPLQGVVKTAVIWYTVNGQLRALTGKEYTSGTFNTAH